MRGSRLNVQTKLWNFSVNLRPKKLPQQEHSFYVISGFAV